MKVNFNHEQREYLTKEIGIPDRDLTAAAAGPKTKRIAEKDISGVDAAPTFAAPSCHIPPQTPKLAPKAPQVDLGACKSSAASSKASGFPPGFIVVLILLAFLLALIGKANGSEVSSNLFDAKIGFNVNYLADADYLFITQRSRGVADIAYTSRINRTQTARVSPDYARRIERYSEHTVQAPIQRNRSASESDDFSALWCIGLLIIGFGGLVTVIAYVMQHLGWRGLMRRTDVSRDTTPTSQPPPLAISTTIPPIIKEPASNQNVELEALIIQPESFWDVACATDTGNVRTRNEDAAMACRIRGFQIIAASDGCGGHRHGNVASRLAVQEALYSIAADSMIGESWTDAVLCAVIERAMYRAAIRLNKEARDRGLPVTEDALRATLILIVGGIDSYVFGYIGDGSGVILRADGTLESFLTPQRAAPSSNVLTASMGPWIKGTPVIGTVPRHVGDLVIVTTDGISDFVEPDFPYQVARNVIEARGDLQHVAQGIVTHLGEARDHLGWICSDNLTCCLMTASPLSPALLSIARIEPRPDDFKPCTPQT